MPTPIEPIMFVTHNSINLFGNICILFFCYKCKAKLIKMASTAMLSGYLICNYEVAHCICAIVARKLPSKFFTV
jgi:hypothetical protein